MKTVIVTGDRGFIGRNYIESLREQGTMHVLGWHETYPCRNLGDDSSVLALARMIASSRAAGIVHLAARTCVDESFSFPVEYAHDNYLSTLAVLRAVAHCRTNLVHMSTDEVYGDCEFHAPYLETDCLRPRNPYSASKAAAEVLVSGWAASAKVNARQVSIIRSCNLVGPGQDSRKLVPRILDAIFAGRPLPLYADGLTRREWCYVSQIFPLFNYLATTTSTHGPRLVNFTTSHQMTTLAMIQAVFAAAQRVAPERMVAKDLGAVYFHKNDRPIIDRSYRISGEALRSLKPELEPSFSESDLDDLIRQYTTR